MVFLATGGYVGTQVAPVSKVGERWKILGRLQTQAGRNMV